MICTENIHRTTKYFLLILLIHCHLCFAQDDAELALENHEGLSWRPSSRHLLYDSNSSSTTSDVVKIVVYLVGVFIITFIAVCCKYCIRSVCAPSTDDYLNTVVHAPSRSRHPTVPVVPSSGRILNPPRSSGTIIFPPEERVFSIDFTGIENPNYHPSMYARPPNTPTVPQFPTIDLINENPPSNDLPPSYESVIRGERFPKVN